VSPLASYRRLLQLAGPLYVAVAFVGRLPLAMSQLGTLLLVSSATGSYTVGGLAAGSLAVATAVGSPVAGALADRLGQRPVLLVQACGGALALVLLVVTARGDHPSGLLVASAALAGLLLPQVGPLARTRWRPLVGRARHRDRLLDTAFSYEGAADEAAFVVGPALVGGLVALVSPTGAVLSAAVLLLVFGSAFALHPSSTRVPRRGREQARPPLRGTVVSWFFLGLLLVLLCVGVLFGATQTGTTVLADAAGHSSLAGAVHAVLGIGSVLAGLGTALLPASVSHQRRMLVAAVALLVLATPLLATTTLSGLVLVVLALGFGVAPLMISVFTLGERTLAPGQASFGLTLLGSAVNVGYALGAGVAGRLADRLADPAAGASGHAGAFAVTVTATGVAVVLACLLQRPAAARVRRDDRPVDPGPGVEDDGASAPQPAHPLLDVV
jgi:MFS family permease